MTPGGNFPDEIGNLFGDPSEHKKRRMDTVRFEDPQDAFRVPHDTKLTLPPVIPADEPGHIKRTKPVLEVNR
jgi:hypothetical protein